MAIATSRSDSEVDHLRVKCRPSADHRSYDDSLSNTAAHAQARTNDNHLQIGRAIAEASNALSSVHPGISISWDRHYQLSNRIAMAWKLASLGIPNALVFLGLTGDREISKDGDYFADDDHWRAAFADYIAGFFPIHLLENDISSGAASFRLLSRSLPAIRSSRPIAERRVGRQAQRRFHLSRQEGPRERGRRIFLPSHQVASCRVLWRRVDRRIRVRPPRCFGPNRPRCR